MIKINKQGRHDSGIATIFDKLVTIYRHSAAQQNKIYVGLDIKDLLTSQFSDFLVLKSSVLVV